MGRTLALRKCGEHEACQLQSINDGEWEHTPSRRPVAQRLAPLLVAERQLEQGVEETKRLHLRLSDEVARAAGLSEALEQRVDRDKRLEQEIEVNLKSLQGEAGDLITHMGEQLHQLQGRLKYLEGVAEGMPALQNLLAEADRLNSVLQGEQDKLSGKTSRLERDMDRLDRLTGKLEVAAKEAAGRSERAARDAAAAAETAVHLGERIPRVEGLLANSEDLVAKLSRLDDVLGAVRAAEAKFDLVVANLRADLNETLRLIAKEREERLADNAKTQRQFREVMKHARPS